jgi:hypothetical protein
MSVLTAPRSAAFTRQLSLPFAPHFQPATKAMRGTGTAGPQHEPRPGDAKARSDKPGGS